MTKTTCDICETKTNDDLKLECGDGQHPHNGSRMEKTIDICRLCLIKALRNGIKLKTFSELSEIEKAVGV